MKLLLMWPSTGPEIKTLFDVLAREGHEVCYYIGLHQTAEHAPKNAIFHDHFDAWDGKSAAALAANAFPPASADLIASMHATESLILTMMNKHFDAAPVDERKHLYYEMLAYWVGVMDRVKPEALIFNDIPHSIYSNILYDLAHVRGIPVLCFEDTWVALRMLSFRDFWKGSDELRAAIARQLKMRTVVADLGPELRSYYERATGAARGAPPAYLADQKRVASGMGLLRHRARIAVKTLREGTFFKLVGAYVARMFRRNLKDEYQAIEQMADVSKPFVYFPLSFQPERTTSPQGGIYADQILAIETLASALPAGWSVYVKEHPSQWWLRGKTRYSSARYKGYYQRIARIPLVRLVPITTKSALLTEHARATATITGTAGWEAILAGKRSIVFGIPWYRDCPGVYLVRSPEDCKRALAEIAAGARAKESDTIAFLKALEDTTVRAHLGTPTIESPKIGTEENMHVIGAEICRLLRD